MPLWDWKYALLLFVANELSAACSEYARAVRGRRFMDLPSWSTGTHFGDIFLLINVPFYWSNVILFIGAFFFLPWQTVLLVAAVVFFVGIPLTVFLMRRVPLFLRVLLCYLLVGAVLFAIVLKLV